jgi:hypothetical protein
MSDVSSALIIEANIYADLPVGAGGAELQLDGGAEARPIHLQLLRHIYREENSHESPFLR